MAKIEILLGKYATTRIKNAHKFTNTFPVYYLRLSRRQEDFSQNTKSRLLLTEKSSWKSKSIVSKNKI